jgi:membrane-bound lytic murein transglycosylase D
MLYSSFSKAVFCSLVFLFLLLPFVSYQHPADKTLPAAAVETSGTVQQVRLNKHAVAFVRNYIQKNNETLESVKERSHSPFKTMDQVFTKYGLPVELKYLAVIESELNPSAMSPVGAAGPWQLMPATAKILGLKVSAGNDERKLYGKSTKAAALYLRDLYTEFGDWLLVMAAYNCGPGPVYTAIRKSGSHNFWALQAYLPGESREHVKKFIATHYYFEGNGSATTLTKAENVKYNRLRMATAAKQAVAEGRETAFNLSSKKLEVSAVFGY